MTYNHRIIEKKWQNFWKENHTFKTKQRPNHKKYYVLDMFPYPSGQGLHVGHPKSYTATDIVARMKRAQDFDVLHPMGWDAFGLPAEQYALDTGNDPAEFTEKNIQNFKRQIDALGFSYDWDREINTTDPKYYQWTQWIFTKLYEHGLAYQADVLVNWCEALGTVLANEEVIDGVSERGGHPVVRKPMRQWVLKITAFADRLIDDLEDLDWPENVKEMQRNWIGRSRGAMVSYQVQDNDITFETFTTRPDTLFGVSYIVMAPEHELVEKIMTEEQAEVVRDYQKQVALKSDLERTSLNKEKTGVFTGAYAIHPITGKPLEIWIADYVLASYGTGVVMAVPAHDERDFDFAQTFDLPIIPVIEGGNDHEAYTESGKMIHSDFLNGLESGDAQETMIQWLSDNNKGRQHTNYRLRDWIFSRQRYWGEPIPVIHWTESGTQVVDEGNLPVILPKTQNIKPSGTGESPLANIEEWLNVTHPETGEIGRRETNTMPQWAGSSWYFIRYMDPDNDKEIVSEEAINHWQNVDLYIGGAEHAVLHLLYARFWHKFLYDLGIVPTKEPFQKLFNQGMILGEDGEKMSKSKGNVINPDDVVATYGADTLRVFEMFMGPLDASSLWSETGLEGSRRFLDRVWRLYVDDETEELKSTIQEKENKNLEKVYHQTVQKVTNDLEELRFNTAISQLMIFMNQAKDEEIFPLEYAKGYIQLLAPIAPHLMEELWEKMGMASSLSYEPWPIFDESLTIDNQIEIVIQINGKIKEKLVIDKDLSKEEVEEIVLADTQIQAAIEGKNIIKFIVVPNRLVNIVVK